MRSQDQDALTPLIQRVVRRMRLDAETRAEALRAAKERELANVRNLINNGLDQSYPPTTQSSVEREDRLAELDAHPAEPVRRCCPAPQIYDGDEETQLPLQVITPSQDRGITNRDTIDGAIHEMREQLDEQKTICKGLQHAIQRKDEDIGDLRQEMRAAQTAQAEADEASAAWWKAKHEKAMEVLRESQDEKQSLEEELDKAHDEERRLRRELKMAREELDERLERDQAVQRRVEIVEDNVQQLQGELDARTPTQRRHGSTGENDFSFFAMSPIITGNPGLGYKGYVGTMSDRTCSPRSTAAESAPRSTQEIVTARGRGGEKTHKVVQRRPATKMQVFFCG